MASQFPPIETDITCGGAWCAHHRAGTFRGDGKTGGTIDRCARASKHRLRIPGRGTWRRCVDYTDAALLHPEIERGLEDLEPERDDRCESNA